MTELVDLNIHRQRHVLLQDRMLSYAVQIIIHKTKWDESRLVNTLFEECIPTIRQMSDSEVANGIAEIQKLMSKASDVTFRDMPS